MPRTGPLKPLPLSELRSGLRGRDCEDLRWYFVEASAAQSGLKSSQGAAVRKLEAGVGVPPAEHHFDFRRLEHVRRARKIEAKLNRAGPDHTGVLCGYFRHILPLIEAIPRTKQGQKAARRLRRDYEQAFTEAMRAYSGGFS